MLPIVIPVGHARRSRYPLFHSALKCHDTAKEVDYDRLMSVFAAGSNPEDLEADVPLDVVAAML